MVKSGAKWNDVLCCEVKILFYGEYQHTLDVKGRIIIPSKFREGLGDSFIITKGFDNCLFIYSPNEWSVFEEKLKLLPSSDKELRQFVRFFFSGASEIEVDKQGRALVPQNLRDFANLEKDVVIIGVSNRIEVWDLEKWNAYSSEADIDSDLIANKMSLLGI